MKNCKPERGAESNACMCSNAALEIDLNFLIFILFRLTYFAL